MEELFSKNEMVDNKYKIQFYINGDEFYQRYRAKNLDNKNCIIKFYNSSKLSYNRFINNELLEVKILSELDHKNIIKLADHGILIKNNQKFHYTVVHFLSGETLEDKFKREGLLSPYAIVPLLVQIITGLNTLHKRERSLIHNNINLKTIYLDYSDNKEKPVITNFEYARYIDDSQNSVELDQLNPFYTAPEVFNGIFTPQSDIFSVGALMYHLVEGVPPWYIEIPDYKFSDAKFRKAILEKRKDKLTFNSLNLDDYKDDPVIAVIQKALSIDVDDRFKNVEEMELALRGKIKIHTNQAIEAKKPLKKPKQGQGFSAIAGMQELKDRLYNDVIDLLNDEEGAEKYGITIPNGMLLYGPPRCGKTFFAERFAEEAGFNYKFIKTSDLASIYIHGSQEKIGLLFKEARREAPIILCFDEIDALVPKRDKVDNASQSGEINEFLTQLNNCGEDGIFVIGTTNYPQGIDSAVLGAGRMDIKIYVPVPDFEARRALFKLYLKNKPVELCINYDKLAELTNNYTAGDIVYIIQSASRFVRKSREKITQNLLEDFIKKTNSSVTLEELNKYDFIKQKFEKTRTPKSTKKSQIGFIQE